MKRLTCLLFALLLMLTMSAGTVLAASDSRSYDFDLTSGGSHEVKAATGDVLTVTLTFRRTDAAEAAEIYAMQDEIRYDDEFFEIVDGGCLTASGIRTTDIALLGGDRAFYLNYASMEGGELWQPEVLIGTFQVRVLATSGSSTLKNENCLASLKDGTDSYAVSVQDLTVTVTDTCTIRLDPCNGDDPTEVTAKIGSKLEKPADPVREGYTFSGWYRDPDLSQPWDFDKDTVTENMTLYAGWTRNGQQPVNPNPPVKTGDSFRWWIVLIPVLALAAIVVLVIAKRKGRGSK